jgi:hypothetical protein
LYAWVRRDLVLSRRLEYVVGFVVGIYVCWAVEARCLEISDYFEHIWVSTGCSDAASLIIRVNNVVKSYQFLVETFYNHSFEFKLSPNQFEDR